MIPFKYNFRNLFVRWRTTLLTAFGFTLIVALLVVMLGFIQGIYDLASKSGPKGNVIVLSEGATDELFSNLNVNDDLPRIWNNTPEVLKEDDKPLASPEIYSVATQEILGETPDGRPNYRFLQVRGIYEPVVAGQVHSMKIKDGGRWFNRDGAEIVMGDGIARLLKVKVGDKFQIRPTLIWTVVGVLDSTGSPFDSEIWAKIEDVGRYFGKDNPERGQRFYTSVVFATENLASAETAAGNIKKRTNLEIGMPEAKYYEELSKGNALFLFAAMFIAIVMSVGGMFGLMNTMFAAVSQRIKDIGVLRVLGFSKGQILVSFLLESLLLAFLGGGLGIALGYLFNGLEQTGVMNSGGGGGGKTIVFQITVNWWVLSVAAGFTLLMGLLGGLLPSFTAMRMKLLDTLR